MAGQPRPPTQFGRALEELGITSIIARSPQAKGRVERLFGTLQDRLVVELRLAGIGSLEAANAFLPGYLPRFNAQFAVPAAVTESAYRPVEAGQMVAQICCFKYLRVVAADNTVTLGPSRLQIQPGAQRRTYAHATVEVHEHLDGSLAVCYAGQLLTTQPAPAEAPRLRARQVRRVGAPAPAGHDGRGEDGPAVPPRPVEPSSPRPPAASHPWRRPLLPQRTKSVNT